VQGGCLNLDERRQAELQHGKTHQKPLEVKSQNATERLFRAMVFAPPTKNL
jgi:hypothetical protein